jgi:hypothetical protein
MIKKEKKKLMQKGWSGEGFDQCNRILFFFCLQTSEDLQNMMQKKNNTRTTQESLNNYI